MLLRYWSWTSAAPAAGLPFGPLRYRAWTSVGVRGAALPFGPLRYRAWTNGVFVPPVVVEQGGGGFPIRIPVDARWRMMLQRDDELLLFVIAAATACGLLDD